MSPARGAGGAGAAAPDSGPVVYDLDTDCTVEDLSEGAYYHATVNGVVDYGVFVDLASEVSGLVHDSNLVGSHAVGDDLVVELSAIRENGDLSFEEVVLDEFDTVSVGPGDRATVADLADKQGEAIHLEGQIIQIKQTGGPTIFQVRDETGIAPCAAFESAGVRAHPDVAIDDIVRVSGTVEARDGAVQVEAADVTTLEGDGADAVAQRLEAATDEQAAPADVEPYVDWPAMAPLIPELEAVAERLREAVLEGRPIRMRHHADGDGLCAGVPLQFALERFIADHWLDPEAPRHLLKRLPSKAPYYELEDVTRDLNYALEDRSRHGQKLPLLLMLDNGSTEEDTPAYRNLAHYDIPIIVIDHHHPDPEAVEPLVEAHVNPYLHDEDYRITTGMLCVELARMIDPDLTAALRHVPAVAGLADRSEGEAMTDYLDLAAEAGYDETRLREVGEALDYVTHWLRYDDGRELVNEVMNVNCDDPDRHAALVDLFAERAERDVEAQLDVAMEHVTHEDLDNGAHLYRLDVERHAKRFTYPAPGKTTGAVHDRKVEETGDPVITIGYGPDFAVLRSDGVRLDIPRMVEELREEFPGAGVGGGGHLVVGSIKFVPGRREEVLDGLVEKMADAEIDEA
ncbi:MAG: DHH family phosphoesterase, partial [Salinirussus sp.]